jgi:hypothetical protein
VDFRKERYSCRVIVSGLPQVGLCRVEFLFAEIVESTHFACSSVSSQAGQMPDGHSPLVYACVPHLLHVTGWSRCADSHCLNVCIL